MPELPEVETIRLGLEKYIVGKKITDVQVRLRKIFSGNEKDIVGAKITEIKRFGKGLVIELSNKFSIAIHIKLTGQLIYEDEKIKDHKHSSKVGDKLPNKWTHIIFSFEKGAKLFYNDLRQFGWIKIIKTKDLKTLPFFKDLGPEPFKDLTLEKFRNILKTSNLSIKVLLLDQKKIAGIGNIYANDALWQARIDPRRKAKTLTDQEIKMLFDAILMVLKKGLSYHGASELNFVDALGQDGQYQKHFLVYAQQGKKCARDKTIIKKIKLSGRGTYFCSTCQK